MNSGILFGARVITETRTRARISPACGDFINRNPNEFSLLMELSDELHIKKRKQEEGQDGAKPSMAMRPIPSGSKLRALLVNGTKIAIEKYLECSFRFTDNGVEAAASDYAFVEIDKTKKTKGTEKRAAKTK